MLKKSALVIGTSVALLMQGPVALAQLLDTTSEELLVVEAQIGTATCVLPLLKNGLNKRFVLELPPLKTISLNDNNIGPVSRFNLSIQSPFANPACILPTGTQVEWVFDSALASVAPRTGLLRNTATDRPAQNVFVQIGLIDQDESFTPIDLNQPQVLNQALKPVYDASDPRLNFTLGIRYVASRSVKLLTTNSQGLTDPDSEDVSAGNIAAFLPFLLKLN
jgi:hypothetical protein